MALNIIKGCRDNWIQCCWVLCPRFLRFIVQGGAAIFMAKMTLLALISILMRHRGRSTSISGYWRRHVCRLRCFYSARVFGTPTCTVNPRNLGRNIHPVVSVSHDISGSAAKELRITRAGVGNLVLHRGQKPWLWVDGGIHSLYD